MMEEKAHILINRFQLMNVYNNFLKYFIDKARQSIKRIRYEKNDEK